MGMYLLLRLAAGLRHHFFNKIVFCNEAKIHASMHGRASPKQGLHLNRAGGKCKKKSDKHPWQKWDLNP
jgi:hypothetical protein